MLPIVVVDRLGPSLYAAASPAGASLSQFKIAEENASSLPGRRPPVWSFLHGLKSPLSSTALRAMRGGNPAKSRSGAKPRA
jgi:nicotinate-nucleotide adenylyltransferase